MLDPSAFWDLTNLLAAPPVAQEPPAIVRPHITQGSNRIEATMAPLVRGYRLAIGEWLEQLSARQEMLACGSDADIRAHRAHLDALIADVEETAEDRAKSATRHRKYREAVTEPLRRSNPAVARVYDDTTRILYEMDRELVDRLLEFGLFARATRARVNPRARGGPVFDDPAELSRYIAAELGDAVRR